MIPSMRQTVVAVSLAVLTMGHQGAWAASSSYQFNTFFDTSTSQDLLDTKTLPYAVATLTLTDISGGVQLTLTQLNNAFAAQSSLGTFIDALWLYGPSGSLSSTSGASLAANAGYSATSPQVKDAGYSYPWNITFAASTFAEGQTATLTIMGSGVSVSSFYKVGTVPMLNLSNVGSPYTSSVHFVGTLVTPAVPEPATWGLMGLGLLGLMLVRSRQARA